MARKNEALAKMYKALLKEADEYGKEKPKEKGFYVTTKEMMKIQEQSQERTAAKLREISQQRIEEEAKKRQEEQEMERKRKAQQEAEKIRKRREEEARLLAELEAKTKRYYRHGKFGRQIETGVVYFGDTKKSTLGSWQPDGYGEYRVKGDLRYDGNFVEGQMQGSGKYTLPNGDIWDGMMRGDRMHGVGTIIFADQSKPKRQAIYWRNRRACWLDELVIGARIKFIGPHHCRSNIASVIGNGSKPWKFKMKFDNEGVREMNLSFEEFKVLKNQPHVVTLDTIIGDTYTTDRYKYEKDLRHRRQSKHYSNFYANFEKLEEEAREKAKEKARVELIKKEEKRKIEEENKRKRDAERANMEALQQAVNEQERKKKEKEEEMKKIQADVIDKIKSIKEEWR